MRDVFCVIKLTSVIFNYTRGHSQRTDVNLGALAAERPWGKGTGGVRGEGFGGRGQWWSAGVLPFAGVTVLFFSSPNWAPGPSSQHTLFD